MRSLSILFFFFVGFTLSVSKTASAKDWNQWGGSPHRNNVTEAAKIPIEWEPGEFDYETTLQLTATTDTTQPTQTTSPLIQNITDLSDYVDSMGIVSDLDSIESSLTLWLDASTINPIA